MGNIMKKSRNAMYEDKKKAAGYAKITAWVPVHAQDDFKEMMAYICEEFAKTGEDHRKLIPYMMRDIVTGRNAGRVR